jgi:hypothetical protein
MTLAQRQVNNTKTRIINIGGDDIKIIHVGFEVSELNWNKMHETAKDMFKDNFRGEKVKSHAMRILVNAVNLGIIDLQKLKEEIEKRAEKSKDIIYI